MSLAPQSYVGPRDAPPLPTAVPSPGRPPSRAGWTLAVLAALLVGAVWMISKLQPTQPKVEPFTATRTATVSSGMVAETVRLTGVTAAENFASLITPQLRGSRTDRLRDNSPNLNTSTPTAAVASNANAGSSSSSTSSSSTALKSATTRSGGGLIGSTGSASTAAANAPASNAFGASGLGTAADSLGGGTPGSGGGNGFNLVLQEVVKPGSPVKKGQVVGEFDRQYMLLRLEDYRSSVNQSEAALRKRKADLEISRRAHDQLIASAKASMEKAKLDLKTIPVLSVMDAERTRLNAEQTEAKYNQLLTETKFVQISEQADIRNAELDLQQSKLELHRAELNVDRMAIKAPIDGLAIMQSIFRGGEFGQIQKGDQLWPGMFFMNVVNPTSMIVSATVNQVDVDRLRVGSKATVRFDAYPGLELPAHVDSVAAAAKPGGQRATFVREVPVRIKIDRMDPRVAPDLSVSADVTIQAESTLSPTVPVAALFTDGSLGKIYVMAKTNAGWERREITLGLRNRLVAAVRSGLRPGDVVAVGQFDRGKGEATGN